MKEAHLQMLRWAAFGLAGVYLWKLFQSKGMSGEFDVDGFIEEGSKVIPHPIVQNPVIKKVAKAYVGSFVHNTNPDEIA